jgi:hypothetical protein
MYLQFMYLVWLFSSKLFFDIRVIYIRFYIIIMLFYVIYYIFKYNYMNKCYLWVNFLLNKSILLIQVTYLVIFFDFDYLRDFRDSYIRYI